ncbi:MAG TPA: hypothetical protein DER60_09660 [Syntrophomonas sp.]|nr:hypothetical protein [Syntrophomonas sp.]
MEKFILYAILLLALIAIGFKVKRLMDTASGVPRKNSCDCGMCSSSSCPVREWPEASAEPGPKQDS